MSNAALCLASCQGLPTVCIAVNLVLVECNDLSKLFVQGVHSVCGVSNYSVSVYPSPLQIPVLELEHGEGMCRLEVGGGEGEGRREMGNEVEESHLIRCTQVCTQSKHIAGVCSSVRPP